MEEANAGITQNLLNYLLELNVARKAILSNVSILGIFLWSFLIKSQHISSLLIVTYSLLYRTYLNDYLSLTTWTTVQHFPALEKSTGCGLRSLPMKHVYTAPVPSSMDPYKPTEDKPLLLWQRMGLHVSPPYAFRRFNSTSVT